MKNFLTFVKYVLEMSLSIFFTTYIIFLPLVPHYNQFGNKTSLVLHEKLHSIDYKIVTSAPKFLYTTTKSKKCMAIHQHSCINYCK